MTAIKHNSTLSPEQQIAHDTLLKYCTGEDTTHAMYTLEGYAGTGKTFTLGQLVATLKMTENMERETVFGSEKYSIAMTAPTHKAVRVLKKFASFKEDEVDFATIHSLLGLREQIDNNGRIKYVPANDPNNPPRVQTYDVLLLDEASMLSDELFQLLLPFVKEGLKLVFIGDPVQIPPVGHRDAIPFLPEMQKKYNIGVVRLDKIMRQAVGNPILEYATRIRQVYKTAPFIEVKPWLINDHGIEVIGANAEIEIKQVIEQYFKTAQFEEDADHMKIIAWRNSTVDNFNRIVREEIYAGTNPFQEGPLPFLVLGEKLIMDKPLIVGVTNRTLLSTNEEITVDSFDVRTDSYNYITAEERNGAVMLENENTEFRYYDTRVLRYNSLNKLEKVNIRILHEDEVLRLNNILTKIEKMAKAVEFGNPLRNKLWVSYYKVQRLFAQVKYNYAITGHKSQGSTYNNCMMISWDLDANRNIEERNRIRYVAATRARNKLFIVK